MYLSEELQKKWGPVLEHPELEAIQDPYKKSCNYSGTREPRKSSP